MSQENNLQGQPAEVRMTISITRAATGITEIYDLVGTTTMPATQEVAQDGNNPQHSNP